MDDIEVRCSGTEFNKRIQAFELPQEGEIHEVEILDLGNADFEDSSPSQSSTNPNKSLDTEVADRTVNWKTVGLRFGQIRSKNTTEEGLYIAGVKQNSPGTESLMRGDRILAIEGIVFDKQTLNALNGDAQMAEDVYRSVSAAITTLYEVATSVLDAWIRKRWFNQPDGRRRPIHLTISRSPLKAKPVTSVAESDYMAVLSNPHYGPLVEYPQAMQYETDSYGSFAQPEEELMEIEMIDFPRTGFGIGAFLTPGANGLGARVERLAEGELAQLVSLFPFSPYGSLSSLLKDGRLQVGDSILYINEKPVMNRAFKDVLRVYRRASSKAESGIAALPYSPLRPIRLIVSRSVKNCGSSSLPTSTHSTTVPQSSVLLEAAKLAADVREGSKSQSVSMATPTTTSPDAVQFHEVNVDNQMGGGVLIEEAVSDPVSGNIETLDSPQLSVDEKNPDKAATPPKVGEYTLPSANAPLGISVETLASIDKMGRQTDFRHRIVEVHSDGVVATQTELKPMDEVLEVSGLAVVGKDSNFLAITLQKPPISGYLVCSRSPESISDQAQFEPTSSGDKMSVILRKSSTEIVQSDTAANDLETSNERAEAVSSSGSRISKLRRKFEASSQEMTSTQPKVLVGEKPTDTGSNHKTATHLRELHAETLGSSDASFNLANDSIEIVINKVKGELIDQTQESFWLPVHVGVTLGEKDDTSGGFTVTDIAPNGALRRTLSSVAVYRKVHFNVGDVVTELNGKHLRHATVFGVQSLLWTMFSLEGNVRCVCVCDDIEPPPTVNALKTSNMQPTIKQNCY
ncbi:unnamed protein product [Hydatigera taeniaeformis]|uniref:PDZ domain-containing protein n=1 Tax=Hydatigena taeniaeformis TaxID=6205 RepID=A0A158REM0_HYDTA|nr:unnamed protein product [Hydatigera taeniaeformis]